MCMLKQSNNKFHVVSRFILLNLWYSRVSRFAPRWGHHWWSKPLAECTLLGCCALGTLPLSMSMWGFASSSTVTARYTRWTCIPEFRRCRFAITAAFTHCFTGKVGWIWPYIQGVILDYGWDRCCCHGNDVRYQPDPEEATLFMACFRDVLFFAPGNMVQTTTIWWISYAMRVKMQHAATPSYRAKSNEKKLDSARQNRKRVFFSLLTSHAEIRWETKICLVSNAQSPPTFGSLGMWIKMKFYGMFPVTSWKWRMGWRGLCPTELWFCRIRVVFNHQAQLIRPGASCFVGSCNNSHTFNRPGVPLGALFKACLVAEGELPGRIPMR